MPDLVITDFTPAHQAAAAELINTGLGSRFGFRDDSRNPDLYDIAATYADDCFLVALLDDRLVATGGLVYESRMVARIVRMHTAEAFRRRGIGAAVLDELIRRAWARDSRELILDTNLDWRDAHAFYTAAGFHELRRDGQGIRYHRLLG